MVSTSPLYLESMSKRLEANDNLVKWKKASRVISLESHWKGMWDFRTRNANFLAYSPPSILQAFWLRNWLSIIECCWVLRKQRENSKLNFTVAPHPTNVLKVISSNPSGNLSKVSLKHSVYSIRKIWVKKTLVYRRSRNPAQFVLLLRMSLKSSWNLGFHFPFWS